MLTLTRTILALLQGKATVPTELVDAAVVEMNHHVNATTPAADELEQINTALAQAKEATAQVQPTMAGPNATNTILVNK